MKKIVFTGGHHNSALSVAKQIIEKKMAEVIWFGHKYTLLGDKNVSAEYQEVTKYGIRFREVKAGKIYRVFNPLHWIRLPWGFLQSLTYLLQEKPDLIVSFGGYLAAPVVFAGWLLRVPIITHEQTTVIGLANRFISRFAKKIFITWPQSKRYFPTQKVILTGLPLRDSIFSYDEKISFFSNNLPTVYITGGKQGSHVINEAVAGGLKHLLTMVNVVHQCGSNSVYKDFETLSSLTEDLEPVLRERYVLRKYVFEEEIGQVFNEADFVLSRAGAHTVYELGAIGKPAIFIPIPWVSHNEQYKNARVLVNAGSATIVPEENLTSEILVKAVFSFLEEIEHYKKQADQVKGQMIYNAHERIMNEIEEYLS